MSPMALCNSLKRSLPALPSASTMRIDHLSPNLSSTCRTGHFSEGEKFSKIFFIPYELSSNISFFRVSRPQPGAFLSGLHSLFTFDLPKVSNKDEKDHDNGRHGPPGF